MYNHSMNMLLILITFTCVYQVVQADDKKSNSTDYTWPVVIASGLGIIALVYAIFKCTSCCDNESPYSGAREHKSASSLRHINLGKQLA